MQTRLNVRDTVRRLDAALELIKQDRWMLTGLRGGRMILIAEGPQRQNGAPQPAHPRVARLSVLARRSLYERRPVAVSTVDDSDPRVFNGDLDEPLPPDQYSWEETWPVVLYAPVAQTNQRPVGLLVIGSRSACWHDEADINYVCALAASLASFVQAALDPLRKLTRIERMVAYLISEGLSAAEVARALRIDRPAANLAVESMLKKLKVRSQSEVAALLEELPSRAGAYAPSAELADSGPKRKTVVP